MRYAEQIRYSWGYHWGIFCEVWGIFYGIWCVFCKVLNILTTNNRYWYIVGVFFAIFMVPGTILILTPSSIVYYATHPLPTFSPSLTQELAITEYYGIVGRNPLLFWIVNYIWTHSRVFDVLGMVLAPVSFVLLLVAYFREESTVRGREK